MAGAVRLQKGPAPYFGLQFGHFKPKPGMAAMT